MHLSGDRTGADDDFLAGQGCPAPVPEPAGFPLYVSVAVNQPVEKAYWYGVPQRLVEAAVVGSLVEIGFAGRRARGCIIERSAESPADVAIKKLKPIQKLLSPEYRLEPELLRLAAWIGDYYIAPVGECISAASFIGFNDVASQTITRLQINRETVDSGTGRKPTAKQEVVFRFLEESDNEPLLPAQIQEATGVSMAVLKRMVAVGLLSESSEDRLRADDYERDVPRDSPLLLNAAQQESLDAVSAVLTARAPRVFLIHGVTGSGKTEIYMQAIRQVLEAGGSAIVLVPEISLTPQTMTRFRSRFGGIVGIYHSRMTIGQKFDLWKRIKAGDCRIMVGARSAVFAPMQDLRIIVVDEEHETSYKQDSSPRYNARDVAIVRARDENAVVLMGSATPSIETYYKATTGKFTLLSLPERIDSRAMPDIRILDMLHEVRENQNPDLLGAALKSAIQQALDRHEQVVLFLNRRGFFNFVVCMECHKAVRCKHCDVTLTHHKPRNQLICHYCSREYVMPKKCPECEATELSLIGAGTQRIEEHLNEVFPGARVVRMDLDTTRKRTAFLDAWRKIESGEAEIILGTQMIAKGFHLENVTLVGVPLADVSLFQPDFYSAERAFSVLTQVAGRAGRGNKPGLVLIQTYVPQHYALQYAQKHDYRGFFEKELRVRQVLRFPPHFRLISVLAQGADETKTSGLIREFARILRNAAYRTQDKIVVLGPVPAPISRINDLWRFRLVIRGKDHRQMRSVLDAAREEYSHLSGRSAAQMIIDVDPQDLM